jgi:hypothetical protein
LPHKGEAKTKQEKKGVWGFASFCLTLSDFNRKSLGLKRKTFSPPLRTPTVSR